MNVVDSRGWLEYFADGSNADVFAQALENTESLIVPSPSIFEACNRVALKRGKAAGPQAAEFMAKDRSSSAVPAPRSLLHSIRPITDCPWRTASSCARRWNTSPSCGRRTSTSRAIRA